MSYGIYSVEGAQHATNEDFVIVDEAAGLYVVCDGMGGHAAGEYASLQAGEYLVDFLRAELTGAMSEAAIFDLLTRAVNAANDHVYALSRSDEAYYDMGTTALIAHLANDRLYLCHIGDSRAYLVEETAATLLTCDQSYVQKLVEEGQITAQQARVHPKRNIILQAVGGPEKLQPQLLALDFTADQVLVLCSDGISDVLTESDIHKIVSAAADGQSAAQQLVERAFQQGSKDDSSAIVVGDLPL